VLKSSKSIVPAVKPARAWLEEQDVAGVCTEHGVQVGLGDGLGGPGAPSEAIRRGSLPA